MLPKYCESLGNCHYLVFSYDRYQVEFAVQMSGAGCAKKVENSLKDVGRVDIDIPTGRVIVHTSLPWIEIQEKIEKTGRKAILSGFGGKYYVICKLLKLKFC